MYINLLNLNLILCSLISTDYVKLFVTTQKKKSLSLSELPFIFPIPVHQ